MASLQDIFRIQEGNSPRRILAIIIGSISLSEVIAMLFIYFFQNLPYFVVILIDVSIMISAIFPVLYFLSFKPLLQQLRIRNQSESIAQSRLRVMQYASAHTLDELLQFTLDEIEALTGSTIGFFHFLEADQKTLHLQAWSTNTILKMCSTKNEKQHYDVEHAGVWVDCIAQRKPVIHNDYASLPHRKGMPEGHARVSREVTVPIIRDDMIVAIVGLGNKPKDYTKYDVRLVSTLADFAWDTIEQKKSRICHTRKRREIPHAGRLDL